MVGYNRGAICRLAKKIDRNPELSKKLGISISFNVEERKENIEQIVQPLDESG